MASSRGYLDFILEQLSGLEQVKYRPMMGKFIIYYRGKTAGYICDDRFLVKPVKSAIKLMPGATREKPYDGAREMLLVTDVDNRQFLNRFLSQCTTSGRSRKQKRKMTQNAGKTRECILMRKLQPAVAELTRPLYSMQPAQSV